MDFGQILVQPLKATASNLKGIALVNKRMKWYCALTDSQFDTKARTDGNDHSSKVGDQLRDQILDLYKALLVYQMKSACWYYRPKGMIILRGLVNNDDWDAELKKVTDVDNALQNDIRQFTGEDIRKNLEGVSDEVKNVSIGIADFEQKFCDFWDSQKNDNTAKCLSDLFLVDPQQSMEDLEQKKGGLLTTASDWILDTQEYAALTDWCDDSGRLLWIKGFPGTGKTMLLISIIKTLLGQFSDISPRVAYFFFQGTGDTSTNATAAAALRSLVWMVLVQQPKLIGHLESAIKRKGPSLFTGKQALQSLRDLFKVMLKDSRLQPTYIIVDALDECLEGLDFIRDLMRDSLSITEKVRWLVSSRPIVNLDKSVPQLVEIDAERLNGPVQTFIDHKLSALKDLDGYSEDILAKLSVEMQKRAGDTFLWVALVFIELMEEDGNLQRPFGIDALEIVKQTPRGLNELYFHMMAKIERGEPPDQQRSKNILSAMVLVQRPLKLSELDILAGLCADKDISTIEKMVKRCGSYLIVADQKVSFIHQSAKDYLQDCYQTRIQPDGIGQGHEDLVSRSIKAMSQGLSQNPYQLSYDTETRYLVVPKPDPLAPYKYSCVFWMDHLGCQIREAISSHKELGDHSEVLAFLENHSLVWLESMSLLGEIPYGLAAIQTLLNVISGQSPTNDRSVPNRSSRVQSGLIELLADFERFVSRNLSMIAMVPLQTYGSALLFSPKRSKIRNLQWEKKFDLIEDVSGIMETWGQCRFILDVGAHTYPNHVVISPNGKFLAVAGMIASVRLYDLTTDMSAKSLYGTHPLSVSFSPDSELVLTAHLDKFLRLWTTATGECKKLLSHDGCPRVAKFSPSGRLFAALSVSTIKIWDTSTTTVRQVLRMPPQSIQDSISNASYLGFTFSPNDQLLAVHTKGCRICVWDTSSGKLVNTFGMERDPKRIHFWPGGKIFVRSRGRTELWELKDDELKLLASHEREDNYSSTSQTLSQFISTRNSSNGHELQRCLAEAPQTVLEHFRLSALCPHGKLLATVAPQSENWLNEVMLWDLSEGRLVQSLRGHSSPIGAVAFSPDGQTLVSSSKGQVRLWDILVDAPENIPEDQCKQFGSVEVVAFSHNGRLVGTVIELQPRFPDFRSSLRLWDTKSGSRIQSLQRELPDVLTIAFDPTDTMLISVHHKEAMFWDCATGDLRYVWDMPQSTNRKTVLFSPEGKHFVVRYNDSPGVYELELFNTTAKSSAWREMLPHFCSVQAWGFSPDGKLLAVSLDHKVEVRDVETGILLEAVDLKTGDKGENAAEVVVVAVAVSSGGDTIACKKRKCDKTIQIWNVKNGTLTHKFEVDHPVGKLSFSADGHYIDAEKGRICLDSTHTACDHTQSSSASVILAGFDAHEKDWIVMDWRKVVQLPPDRSATAAAFSHGNLVIGHRSGDVTFLKLKGVLENTSLQ